MDSGPNVFPATSPGRKEVENEGLGPSGDVVVNLGLSGPWGPGSRQQGPLEDRQQRGQVCVAHGDRKCLWAGRG